MFQFRWFPPYAYGFSIWYTDMTLCGFPHSDVCGSLLVCSSPQLFAAYHVLLRLLVPRHSPCALCSLTVPVSFTGSLEDPCTNKIFPPSLQFPTISCFFDILLRSFFFEFIQFSMCVPLPFPLRNVVGLNGLEPATSRLSGARSNHLSYRPMSALAISFTRDLCALVEMMRLELTTPCLQSRCSPS